MFRQQDGGSAASGSEVGWAAAVDTEWDWALGCHNWRMTGQIGVSGMSVILPCCTHTAQLTGLLLLLLLCL